MSGIGIRVCLSEIGPKMPIQLKKDICMEIREPTRPVPRENRFFSAKAYWFWATREIDIEASYLQVGLSEGLVKMWWGSVEIKSASQFKAAYKAMYKFKYVATPHKTFWAGLVYEDPDPRVQKNVYCETYEQCIKYRAHIYKNPVKYIPQVLLGWAKKQYGINTIDYIAGTINKYMRQVCAPDRACIAHIHDGLVYSAEDFKPPKLKYKAKTESVNGWSFAGVVAPGEPPRHWGFMPSHPEDVLLINSALKESKSPKEAYRRIEHLCLFPEIFERALEIREAPGLVDLEYLVKGLGYQGLVPEIPI